MAYIVVKITNHKIRKSSNDILIAYLNELGYEAFEEHLKGVDAYIQEDLFDETILKQLQDTVKTLDFSYQWNVLEEQNWNKTWEENYQPVVIAEKLLVRSTFHKPIPTLPFEVIINPQMSFGTGHHQTTSLMLEALLSLDLQGKKVLDVGCGTGILAIFAVQRGAEVVGVDIDKNSYQNALENLALNNVAEKIQLKKGTVQMVREQVFDIILANINRNVLLQDMNEYAQRLKPNGTLLLSGFYSSDIDKMQEAIEKANLKKVSEKILEDWTLLEVKK